MAVDKKGLGKAQKEFQKNFKKRLAIHSIMHTAISLAAFIAGVVVIFCVGVNVYHVNGNGMGPSLKDGSYAIGNKLAYTLNEPQRGDVVATNGSSVYRIIGLPGETVEFNGGFVYVNGKMLNEEAYLNTEGKTLTTTYSNETYIIPEDNYFVLCDNRNCFKDSRERGLFITKDHMESKIFFTF